MAITPQSSNIYIVKHLWSVEVGKKPAICNGIMSSHLGRKRKLLCHFLQERLHLCQLQLPPHLQNKTPAADRRHIVVYGPFTAAHTLAQAFTGDRLVRGPEPPQGKCGVGVHLAVYGQTHHLNMTEVQVAPSHGLRTKQRNVILRNSS